MAGMGGGGAGVTALLARRGWLLVRGQRGANGAADAAEAQIVRTAKPCRLKRRWAGGRGRRGGWGIMAKGLLRLCWRWLDWRSWRWVDGVAAGFGTIVCCWGAGEERHCLLGRRRGVDATDGGDGAGGSLS